MKGARGAPWLCPRPEAAHEQSNGLWAQDSTGTLECMRRVARDVTDPVEARSLINRLLDMLALFRAGEACAPFTAELWRYQPSALERVEDQAQR